MQVLCVVLNNPKKCQTVAEAALQFTPQVALGKDCIFLEISQCTNLFSVEDVWQKMRELLVSMELTGSLALGSDPGSALSFAKFVDRSKVDAAKELEKKESFRRDNLPIETLEYFLSPFNPENALASHFSSLRSLGICQIGDLRRIPPKTLASRFGKKMLLAYQNIFYGMITPWPIFHSQEKIIERVDVDLEHQVLSLEPLLFLLRPLVEQVVGRLRGRGLGLLSFHLRFELENYSTVETPIRVWSFYLGFLQTEVSLVLPIIRERLNRELQNQPLESSVTSCEVEVLEAAVSNSQQKNMLSKKEEEKEAWGSLVVRLDEKLGSMRSFVASPVARYLPEASWQKSKTDQTNRTDKASKTGSEAFEIPPTPKRPLILFRYPRPVRKIDSFFIYRQSRYKIRTLEGPETLSGEWWIKNYHRNYYTASLEDNSKWWVYTTPESPDFYFWHGIFD